MAIKMRNKVSLEFSMASMSDMVFLLLIFFMISSTLISPNAVKLLLPQSSNQINAKPFTTISITADLKYYVETQEVDFSQIESILRTKMNGTEDPTISLHTDRSVPIGEVVRIMNLAKNNNYKLILATTPK
jgi:biopolymer transport protein ExbD